jgi:hypothetical protein
MSNIIDQAAKIVEANGFKDSASSLLLSSRPSFIHQATLLDVFDVTIQPLFS